MVVLIFAQPENRAVAVTFRSFHKAARQHINLTSERDRSTTVTEWGIYRLRATIEHQQVDSEEEFFNLLQLSRIEPSERYKAPIPLKYRFIA